MRGHAPGSAVRYRPDTGFEARCDDCARRGRQCFWPLTFDFWDPSRPAESGGRTGRSMARCRACWKARDTRDRRRRYHHDAAMRARVRERNARYRAECRDAILVAQRAQRQGIAA